MKKTESFVSLLLPILLFISCGQSPSLTNSTSTADEGCIGSTVQTYKLQQPLNSIIGMDFQDNSDGKYLYIFEGSSQKIFRYELKQNSYNLNFVEEISVENAKLFSPRGLAYAKESSGNILYFLDHQSGDAPLSLLYKYNLKSKELTSIDLTKSMFDIGTKEVFDVTVQGNSLLISFDPSKCSTQEERVMRGIVKISLDGTQLEKQMPGPGKTLVDNRVEACRSLTDMTLDGHQYLWGTVGRDYIYLLDGITGRGIFFFEKPKSLNVKAPFTSAMAFGSGYLWVSEQTNGIDLIHRVNVLNNLQMAYEGPKRLREIRLTVAAKVEKGVTTPKSGFVYETYCHPYSTNTTGHQGIIPNTLQCKDLSDAKGTKIENLSFHPAKDTSNTQNYTLVTYDISQNSGVRNFQSEFILNVWTREFKNFIYPHLVRKENGEEGTKYLDDDTVLYKIKESKDIYERFISRVKEYTHSQYNTDADMDNPYWAARNIEEYIRNNYHYPIDETNHWATYDFKKGDFNSHPGNLKAVLSEDNNFEDNIIACSGTSMMSCGIYRSIGLPARWCGVSQEVGWMLWKNTEDVAKDEFLQHGEEAIRGNGHRFNEIWLGKLYGWQIFDATPSRPKNDAFTVRPEMMSQWNLMEKSCSGIGAHRIIHNILSEFWPNLYVPLEDGKSINNSGAYRYNLLATFTHPEDFEMSDETLVSRPLQFIDDVNITLDDKLSATISWKRNGEWGTFDPEATLNVVIEKPVRINDGEKVKIAQFDEIAVLAYKIPYTQESLSVDLSKYDMGTYRVKVYKVGDNPTGNAKLFEILK